MTPLKPSLTQRVLAKAIDLVVMMLVAAVLPVYLGPVIGFLYSLFCDGITLGSLEGQSIGKKIIGLRVVNTNRNFRAANLRDSLIRNAPVGAATFFSIIPFWGWLIMGLVGLPLALIELYLIRTLPNRTRLGDVMADTQVIVALRTQK